MKNIWQIASRPILALAPMEDVTDTVLRRIIAQCGRPTVFFTEFTNADGLFSKGSEVVKRRLLYTEEERPIIAQIWGTTPENYYNAARLLQEMNFDGIDINMGCPEKNVIKKGACSALINNRSLASEIITATKEGAGKIPVSVKTRIGFHTIITDDWLGFLLEQGIAALTVHGRTVKEMSKVPAHWDEIGKAVKLRDSMGISTVILGNGDVSSYEDAMSKIRQYKLDGVMIGRGIFHDPWIFNPTYNGSDVPFAKKVQTLLDHIELFESTWGKDKPFHGMKKLFKCYINGVENASELRTQLTLLNTPEQVKEALRNIIS